MNNIIGQKDALVSLELARDSKIMSALSKRDSTAMKLLALVTILFLPSSVVASVFAMPVLDWTSDDSIIKPGFSFFWAFTIPLTIVMLAIYTIWEVWQMRDMDKKSRAAVQKLDMVAGQSEAQVLLSRRAKIIRSV